MRRNDPFDDTFRFPRCREIAVLVREPDYSIAVGDVYPARVWSEWIECDSMRLRQPAGKYRDPFRLGAARGNAQHMDRVGHGADDEQIAVRRNANRTRAAQIGCHQLHRETGRNLWSGARRLCYHLRWPIGGVFNWGQILRPAQTPYSPPLLPPRFQ